MALAPLCMPSAISERNRKRRLWSFIQPDWNAASCRLSGVYGPMDRWRPSRAYHCPPYVVVHRALEGRTIGINALEAVGDHIHAGDVATGIIALMLTGKPFKHNAYNIALGRAVTLEELVKTVEEIFPGTQ